MPLNIAVPIDTNPGETRVPVSPVTAKKLTELGFTVTLESGAGVLLTRPKTRRLSDDVSYNSTVTTIHLTFEAYAAIAQLGERQTEDLKVPGSIPGRGTYTFCDNVAETSIQ